MKNRFSRTTTKYSMLHKYSNINDNIIISTSNDIFSSLDMRVSAKITNSPALNFPSSDIL